MAERMTTASLPGRPGAGIMLYGLRDPAHVIAEAKRHAAHQLAQAQAVLDAPDAAFLVETHTGVHVTRNRRVLQEPAA